MQYFCARLFLINALGGGPVCLPIFQCHVFWSYFQAPVTIINFARVAS